MNLFEQIIEATVAGDEKRCVALAHEVIAQGMDPFEAIQEGFTKAMLIVGDKFSAMEIYLPQVILCADAMNAAVEILKPHMTVRQDGGSTGSVVLGTIQGDIHDLGKNIVKTMLQAAGFTVHDLGRDVPFRQFVDKAVETEADIIGVSAILTTTMSYMPDIVDLLKEMDLRDKFKVMVGGAPITPEFANAAGADAYGEDAKEAIAIAKDLMAARSQRREQ
jgi:corrinoid protein of di/trimethylamine methyltransferase